MEDQYPSSRKAVLLDRDGVLTDNSTVYYLTDPSQLSLNPGVRHTLAELKERGYLLAVITNQGGISLGKNSVEKVDRVHDHLQDLLGEAGIRFEEIYYCPHHPEKEACLCRKPLPLLLEKSVARFGIDPDRCWFVGDSESDVEAGKAAGLHTIRVEANGDLGKILDRIPS